MKATFYMYTITQELKDIQNEWYQIYRKYAANYGIEVGVIKIYNILINNYLLNKYQILV